MPFGLTNAPATFQRMVDKTLKDLIGTICLVYLDDIIVFSKTVEEHMVHLELVFERLRRATLKLNREKCYFMKEKVIYLGHVINQDGLFPCEDKVKAIKDFPIPKTVKQLQSFLGITGYYRKFIKDYAKIASPLFKACAKNMSFKKMFDKRCENAFEQLKETITDESLRFRILMTCLNSKQMLVMLVLVLFCRKREMENGGQWHIGVDIYQKRKEITLLQKKKDWLLFAPLNILECICMDKNF